MTAWARLLAASSLTTGTAWQLLGSPKTGSGLVINDGIDVRLGEFSVDVEVSELKIEVEVQEEKIEALVESDPIEVEVSEKTVEVELQ